MMNLEKAYELFTEAMTLDETTVQALIGMLVDLVACRTGEDPLEVIDRLQDAVICVNKTEGRMVI